MAYQPTKESIWVLKYPVMAAMITLLIGLGLGFLSEKLFQEGLFERFGALNVAIGVLMFGTLASELLVRAQGSFIMGDDGEPGEPFKFARVRTALKWQTFVVFVGTIQWGFGSLLFSGGAN